MSTLNEDQQVFLKNLMASINQAISMQKDLITAFEIGGGIQNQQAVVDHFDNLGSYINAGLRMVLSFNLAFSYGAKAIANELKKDVEN